MCLARAGFLVAPAQSPAAGLYAVWAGDYSAVPASYLGAVAAGHAVALLLVVVEAALVHQAWTMVTLWPRPTRRALAAVSVAVGLAAVGFRLALAVLSARAVLDITPPMAFFWLMQASLAANAASIFWFCALFNFKLLLHLVCHRGVLPSPGALSSIEVLVMTNGVLMIVPGTYERAASPPLIKPLPPPLRAQSQPSIRLTSRRPVVFAGLEWGRFQNFEAASLTPTSVAVILPLGTLAAQRVASRLGSAADGPGRLACAPLSGSSRGSAARRPRPRPRTRASPPAGTRPAPATPRRSSAGTASSASPPLFPLFYLLNFSWVHERGRHGEDYKHQRPRRSRVTAGRRA